jgi:hypothetical protein
MLPASAASKAYVPHCNFISGPISSGIVGSSGGCELISVDVGTSKLSRSRGCASSVETSAGAMFSGACCGACRGLCSSKGRCGSVDCSGRDGGCCSFCGRADVCSGLASADASFAHRLVEGGVARAGSNHGLSHR